MLGYWAVNKGLLGPISFLDNRICQPILSLVREVYVDVEYEKERRKNCEHEQKGKKYGICSNRYCAWNIHCLWPRVVWW